MPHIKPSEFLETLDSHGIYDAEILSDLEPKYRNIVPKFTAKQTERAIANSVGTHKNPDNHPEIYGWTTASALAQHILGEAPGNKYLGRGSAFRANLAGLKEAGH